jgi:hypothetical protein
MKVNCGDCGYQGEIDGRTWTPALRCPKCGICTLERGGPEITNPPAKIEPHMLPRKTIGKSEMIETITTELKPEKAIWDSWNAHQKFTWVEAHKQAILEDVQKMGPAQTRKKWGIKYYTWKDIKARWEIKDGRTYKSKRGGRHEIKIVGSNTRQEADTTKKISIGGRGLPSLPEFSDKWVAQVQVQWLEIYRELLKYNQHNSQETI